MAFCSTSNPRFFLPLPGRPVSGAAVLRPRHDIWSGCVRAGAALTGSGVLRGACPAAGANEETPVDQLLTDYLPLAVFLGVSFAFMAVLLIAPFLVAVRNPDPEKVSAYECGFNAFDDARMRFDVRFYLVSILFIIFDLEVAFLFPWAVVFKDVGVFGFWSMMLFLGVLTVGFIYEWRKGALEWD